MSSTWLSRNFAQPTEMEVDAVILQRPAQPFDHAVVAPSPFPAHADLDLCIRQHVDPRPAGALAALICIEFSDVPIWYEGAATCPPYGL